jgi:hypothetical protein
LSLSWKWITSCLFLLGGVLGGSFSKACANLGTRGIRLSSSISKRPSSVYSQRDDRFALEHLFIMVPVA